MRTLTMPSGGARCMFAVAVLIAALVLAPGPAPAADDIAAVTTPGTATLTMCRDWLLYDACTAYHNVVVPSVIAVGDKVKVTFGSNPKDYDFHVAGIRRDGDRCTILSDHTGANDSGEKIEVEDCHLDKEPANRSK